MNEDTMQNVVEQLDNILCECILELKDLGILKEALNRLPRDSETAEILYGLTDSFDGLVELYEVLFFNYKEFLTPDKREELYKKAKSVFQPAIWCRWEALVPDSEAPSIRLPKKRLHGIYCPNCLSSDDQIFNTYSDSGMLTWHCMNCGNEW